MTKHLTIKSKKVQLDGNKLTGDTYPIKQWIKTYLNGQWDANGKAWTVDLGQVEMWSTGRYPAIQPATAEQIACADSRKSDVQNGIWQRDGALTEDY